MPVRCGIDLGTTYSSISWFDRYNNRVDTIDLESADGGKVLRSVVYFPGGGQSPVVGETAWNAARHEPERVVVGIKRSMGTAFRTRLIDGREFTPPEVSAEILKVLVRDAEAFLGERVTDVVITVPAYFGECERAATEQAGKLAGLTVLGLLPEPHAAALAYAVDKVADIVDRHLLVYDLGGGTLDVTLIHARTGAATASAIQLQIDTLCKDGNRELGGLDWDRALAELVAEKVADRFGVDVWQDAKNEAALLDNCEKAKRHLTRTSTVSIVADLEHHQVDVTDGEFEDRTRDLLLQTQMLLERVLDDAQREHGLSKDHVDVMLTGGSSRMPMVGRMLEAVMGKPPLRHRNPELLVTIGAAYWAHLLDPDNKVIVPVVQADGSVAPKELRQDPHGLMIIDTAPYSIGVEVMRTGPDGQPMKAHAVVLPRGAKYNQTCEKEFATAADDMTEIPVRLYIGDSNNLDECRPLLTYTLTGLPPNRPKGQPVKVVLAYDSNGILRGKAMDVNTDTEVEIIVDRNAAE